ncbi:hypothetical protein N8Z24_00605 [bacterium]|nr:hypothetical protein [bacterium]
MKENEMMELLLWLNPAFFALNVIIALALVVLVCVAISSSIAEYGKAEGCWHCTKDTETERLDIVTKVFKKYAKPVIILGLLLIVLSPITCVRDSYKEVLLYRGVNSENAEKIVDSTTRIIEMAEKYVEQKVEKEGAK